MGRVLNLASKRDNLGNKGLQKRKLGCMAGAEARLCLLRAWGHS